MRQNRTDHHAVIGIDQSYEDTGIAIACDGKIKAVDHILLSSLKNNTERRNEVSKVLMKFIDAAVARADNVEIIVERIRLRSDGFISMDYIKGIGALVAVIVDTAAMYQIPVYSVDTRAWKTAIVGTTKEKSNKYGFNPKKWPTILWCVKNGFKRQIINYSVSARKKKAVIEKDGKRYTYNDNKADAICIALYGFVNDRKLQEEH